MEKINLGRLSMTYQGDSLLILWWLDITKALGSLVSKLRLPEKWKLSHTYDFLVVDMLICVLTVFIGLHTNIGISICTEPILAIPF